MIAKVLRTCGVHGLLYASHPQVWADAQKDFVEGHRGQPVTEPELGVREAKNVILPDEGRHISSLRTLRTLPSTPNCERCPCTR